ncbi:Crp/Fnr family transcriptional regulator [Arcticibacter tournemirensis]|uniref:Crp/Fnr family transcriptional regulator n=1 Tax=Arcticibacter tournemirensis TaxID=699437 RepID=A0A4Q0MAS1_9SPHI|nr:Crp/Fnr family transcriptional regulator [Arcticibacter tournemirensis]RXF70357.1 Crp/Fnr family transcriptional regulator [Arcticibacter tournemirensis]
MEKPTDIQLNIFRDYLSSFVVFNDQEWDIFSEHLFLRKLKKKALFVESGKVCNEVGFILEGSARYFHIKDGEEVTTYFSIENDLVSSYKSFLTQQASLLHIEALENTEMIVFTSSSLQLLLTDERVNLKMERFGRMVAEAVICCYEDRVFSFVTQTPEERYLQLLQSGSDIIHRIPQHYIANYLGITPVSLSRIRKRIVSPAHSFTV